MVPLSEVVVGDGKSGLGEVVGFAAARLFPGVDIEEAVGVAHIAHWTPVFGFQHVVNIDAHQVIGQVFLYAIIGKAYAFACGEYAKWF